MSNQKKRLGEILIGAGLITEDQLRTTLGSQKRLGGKLGSTLVRLGFVTELDLLRCLSAQLRLPSVDISEVKISPRALKLIPLRVAEKYTVIPVAVKEGSVILAMSDPTNPYSISEIQFQTGVTVRPVVATESSITRAIDEYYRKSTTRPTEGYWKRENLPLANGSEEMIIIHRGEERVIKTLDGLDTTELVHLLIRILEEKGVIRTSDLEAALRTPQ